MKTLVLIPAFNESPRIGVVVRRVRELYPEHTVVVIDDGSRDETAHVAQTAGAKVISHSFNMGYGVAIQTGYKYALRHGYDALVQLDGDGQHDPVFIQKLLEPIGAGEADFVVGSRFLGLENYTPSLVRRAGMVFFRRIVSLLIGQRITDSTSGFQAFNRQVIRYFTTEVFPCDYPDADMLLALHRAGYQIREVPARMYASATGKSMHRGWKPFYYLFKMLLSISVTLLREKQI
ncbi:MAG: glycosyltransferase family 2 protein [Desulfuromonadales bacterium]|nr:glycosyltransferase family 2 protein [Desulfuromonadales bacterium]